MECDVLIIGGGISGLMAAVRISEKKPNARIVLLEKGEAIEKRVCPALTKGACVHCAVCSITAGMAGAGAFSDGKFVLGTQYGGWLSDIMEEKQVLDYIDAADAIMMRYGAPADRFQPSDELKALCLGYNLHMLQSQIKHLGTEVNFSIMKNLIADLSKRITIYTRTQALRVEKSGEVCARHEGKELFFKAGVIIFAVGRAGSGFLEEWCKEHNVELQNNRVDVGVRVELPRLIWKKISERIYEPKILFRSKKYGDITRTFCFNDGGYVVMENNDGILSVNGHAYKSEDKKSGNSNFALLVSTKFTEPFHEPIEYAKDVARLANKISGGSVLVQRLGDLMKGRRTDESRLKQSYVQPTLKSAVPGDLSLCMPKRQLDNIIETLYALDRVAPGTANYDTLLYGAECKYYSARPSSQMFELTGAKRIFAIGDGSGYTRSLSQAAANGLIVADRILENYL